MRIAHVTATFPPYYGGTGTVCYHNALGLARLGHEVTVLTPGGKGGEGVDPPGVTVRRLPALFRIGNAPFAPGLLNLRGFDVVHLHCPFYFGGEAVWLGAIAGRLRYVVTYHQDVLFRGPLCAVAAVHHALLGRQILTRADRVLATSWDYARSSRLRRLLSRAPGTVEELPNGVDVTRFHPKVDPAAVRGRYGLGPDEAVILFVGGLDRAHHFKGVGVLLRAMALLPLDDTRLLVVGEGGLRPAYEKEAVRLGLEGRVRFCGRVPDEELPAHYAACDVLALPSTTMGEAFGVVLLEAMSTGKPVIASNLPGVRSVVSDGVDGLLVRAGDSHALAACLERLLRAGRAERRSMGEAGRRKVVARYTWETVAARLDALYREVVRGTGRAVAHPERAR